VSFLIDTHISDKSMGAAFGRLCEVN